MGTRTRSDPKPGAALNARLARFITRRTTLRAPRDVPEIVLHLADSRSGLSRLAARDPNGFSTPYWAYCWGGGLALARYLLDHPDRARAKRVVDLGSGSGIVGIAAARAGAASVCCIDPDPRAATACALNAAANGVALDAVTGDETNALVSAAEVLLVGDLFYEADTAVRVGQLCDRAVAAGCAVLIGDPFRAHLPRDRVAEIARYAMSDFGLGASESTACGVFAWRTS